MRTESLQQVIAPAISAVGLELWGVEYLVQGRFTTLRIYIERGEAAPVSVEDCKIAAQQVQAQLAANPVSGLNDFHLEVSSPGIHRRLFQFAQCERYFNHEVQIKLRTNYDGRKNFKGTLVAAQAESLVITAEGEEHQFAWQDIDRIQLCNELL